MSATDQATLENTSRQTLLVLLAHGSSDPAWQKPFQEMTASIAANQKHPVKLGFMELCGPSLEDIAKEIPQNEATDIEILPLFFSAGRHLRKDVPMQIKALNQTFSHLNFTLHDPVGFHPKMTEALTSIAADLDFSDKK
ncbi:sirohydrochlorin chelatase [Oceanospirillum sanctuarii]|uniref:sirohydrochlorin chelatase n=1 Tax=Oceanospirillum sanctuarii TaxID=1434821 RepID=UPI000A38C663|nr:CbiX/SirB N-terminal domain-containing protein [Oceanospirillum sanctuarii]